MIQIRPMQAADIPFGLALCRQAGWNHLEADWRRLLALAPQGVFVAEELGRPGPSPVRAPTGGTVLAGTASALAYGPQTAWIGMVLVHQDFRRRGIATALMTECIGVLQDRRVESIKLDATQEGRQVYLKLGFLDERPVVRYACPGGLGLRGQLAALQMHPQVRTLRPADIAALAALDRTAFGADRTVLLAALALDGEAVLLGEASAPRGYGFARAGYLATYLGPIVARDPEAAQAVVETLLARLHLAATRHAGQRHVAPRPAAASTPPTRSPEDAADNVFWDVLADDAPAGLPTQAGRLAEALGFSVARRLTRMYLGEKMNPGEVGLIYGIAGFEFG